MSPLLLVARVIAALLVSQVQTGRTLMGNTARAVPQSNRVECAASYRPAQLRRSANPSHASRAKQDLRRREADVTARGSVACVHDPGRAKIDRARRCRSSDVAQPPRL